MKISARATVAAAGDKILDEKVVGPTLAAEMTIEGTDPVISRSGFSAWAATVTCAEQYCVFERESINIPFIGEPNFWGLTLSEAPVIGLEEGQTRTFVFATAPDVQEVSGRTTIAADPEFIEGTARLSKGNYRMDRGGLTRLE